MVVTGSNVIACVFAEQERFPLRVLGRPPPRLSALTGLGFPTVALFLHFPTLFYCLLSLTSLSPYPLLLVRVGLQSPPQSPFCALPWTFAHRDRRLCGGSPARPSGLRGSAWGGLIRR